MNSRQSIYSPLWHRVEGLCPRLRPQTLVERHVVRGEVWYVAKDRFGAHSYRFSPAVYAVLMRMDGVRSLDQIWHETVAQFGENAPAQDQIISVVSQLYAAELVDSDRPVDHGELAARAATHSRRMVAQRFQNPMFLRLPLADPDRFLEATVHLVRPFCGLLGACLWLTGVIWFVAEAALHWGALSSDVGDRLLATDNLVTLLLVFPVLKILHELGHAYAVKLAGHEVHEIGIMILTFMPAPYVDASAAAVVPNKWRRAMIGAAGMVVELAVAVGAMAVWLSAQPGLVRSIAYDTMLIASVSTLVFNGNPLLRFDAYYIMSDLLELPNLAGRAQRYYAYLAQRYLFGLMAAPNPAATRGERAWFLLYAPASLVYRLIVVTGIILFIGPRYFFIGVAMVVWLVAATFLWPAFKILRFVLVAPPLAEARLRAMAATATVAALCWVGVGLVPIPYGTVARGVVWIPEEVRIVAETAGRCVRFAAEPGTRVEPGDVLVELDDPYIASRRRNQEGRLAELEARLTAAEPTSPFDTQVIRRQVDFARDELAEFARRARALTVRSEQAGIFVVPNYADLVESHVKQGQVLGYVMTDRAPVIRATIPEAEIEPVRTGTHAVSVRLDGAPTTPIETGRIVREFPEATRRLPHPALASANGGPFTVDPSAKEQNVSLLPFFEIDIAVPADLVRDHWGERAWVRFDHGAEPLLGRLWRATRQVFLEHFHV
jgi:putative peptide zinc metalloprotease protein